MLFLADAAMPGESPAFDWSKFLNNYITQDILVALVASVILGTLMILMRREHWRAAVRQMFRSRLAAVSFAICCVFALIALLDSIYWPSPLYDGGKPVLGPHGEQAYQVPYDTDTLLDDVLDHPFKLRIDHERTYSAPFASVEFEKTTDDKTGLRIDKPLKHPGVHWLGTDANGQDVLYKCFKGVRTGMILGLLTTLFAAVFATVFGIMAGYYGGWIDDLIQYVYTTIGSIPSILLIIAFVQVFGRGLFQLCVIMGISGWVGLCRLLRGESLKLREMEYVQAARALGVPWHRILRTHILPNVMHIILISVVLSFSGLVLAEAVLAYIGVGLGPGAGSWGNMISSGKEELSRDPVIWWTLVGAFVSMLALVFPANLLGDAVRDALDPRMHKGEE